MSKADSKPVSLGEPLTISQVVAVAEGARVAIDAGVEQRLERSVALLSRLLAEGREIYGVTTGFGASLDNRVAEEQRAALALNLLRFHGCGTGRLFDEKEARAIVLARLASLVRGHSAVRFGVVERLVVLLNRGAVPAIPSEGSVGASGDLTPLSYLAAVLVGERELWFKGEVLPSEVVLREFELLPLELRPKESLALMNGTSVMVGLGCLAFERAERLCRWTAELTAAASDVSLGQASHFDARLFALKPHPGSVSVAAWIRAGLQQQDGRDSPLQDRYSLRCAPHVIGVLVDQLRLQRETLETELNSANDNPVLDVESEQLLHGGHFYGGHVCQLMDSLKAQVANLVDLMDRQLLLLCDPTANRGLPPNLTAPQAGTAHHGFKAMQITTSALAAEACKLSMPASVFSRSTENHNQDKVSMGTIAARDGLRVLELAEQVAAIHTLAVAQALELRRATNPEFRPGPALSGLHRRVRAEVAFNDADRRMDRDIDRVLGLYRGGRLRFSFEAGAFEAEAGASDGSG